MARGNETTTKFKVDISELKKGIQDANRQIKLANAEFKAAASGMDDWQKSTDGIQRKIEQLRTVLSNQKTILDSYKRQLELISAQYGENSKEADEMRIKIANQQTAVNNTERSLESYTKQLDNMDDSMQETTQEIEKTNEGFTVFKGVLADLVASGIKAVIDGFKNMIAISKEAYQEFDKGRDNVIKATGATGDAAKELQKSYSEVAKSVVGDMSDIGSALGEVNTRFGFTGGELEEATEQFIKFADITGTDATTAVRLVSRAMGDAGIDSSEYVSLLDDLAVAAQASGITVDKLTDNLTKYGAPMRALGFNTKQSIAIFSQWEKAGVNTEIAFSGMKQAISKFSADGKDARAEFQKTLETIAAAPNIADATTKAIDVFGKKAGPDLADAIQNGRFEYSEFLTLLEGSKGAVENTFNETQDASDKVKLAFQGMKVSLGETAAAVIEKYGPQIESAIEKITPVVNNAIQWIADKIPPAIEIVKKAFDTIAPYIRNAFGWIVQNKDALIAGIVGIGAAFAAWNVASVIAGIVKLIGVIKAMGLASAFAAAKQWLLNTAMMANPIGLVVAAIAGLVAAFIVLWKRSEKFRNFWIGLWEKVKKVAGSAWESIKGFFTGAMETIQKIWGGVTGFFTGLWDSIKNIFSSIVNWITENVFKPLADYFAPTIQFYVEAFTIIKEIAVGCWEAIKAVWSVVSEWFTSHVIEPVTSYFSEMWGNLKYNAELCWKIIKGVWQIVSNWFKNSVIQPVTNFFSTMWENLKQKASDAWNGIKSVFSPVADWFKDKFSKAWQAVKDVFSTGGRIFDGIKEGIVSAFKTVVNAIIRGINRVISIPFNAINGILDRIQNVSIAGVNPFDFLNTRLTIPQIPELKRGGVLKRGQMGLLEGNGTEAVVPLENNRKWIAATAADLKNALMSEGMISSGFGKNGVVNNYNFTQNNTSPKALSRLEIYRQSKNLLSWKGAT